MIICNQNSKHPPPPGNSARFRHTNSHSNTQTQIRSTNRAKPYFSASQPLDKVSSLDDSCNFFPGRLNPPPSTSTVFPLCQHPTNREKPVARGFFLPVQEPSHEHLTRLREVLFSCF